ncbi:MAG TPA: BTAD domain-containing putative transcriptional regulator [Chloroflexota bacterium]|nr:BTAD domain-containing putative transcriptional regulator [Chloroflexota bacterium]
MRRQGTVRRRRLLDFLHRHLDRRLQLVVAPPGYGKTTLLVDLAHEVREQGVPVCWLSLDEADADVRSFFEHVVLSIRQQFPTFGQQTLALLRSVEDAVRERRAIAANLANEVVEQLDEFFLLVLDDYHAVGDAAAVHDAVDWLIQRLPEGCRVILGSRVIPTQLNLAALAARLEIAGLGTGDLRFRPEEASELIRLRNGQGVHPREAERAVSQAEGWVTAILLSLHAREALRFPAWRRGRSQQEPVYEYLATQVFDHLDRPLQQFLMESAVLRTLSAAECDTVLERDDSAEQLAQLVQMGLFVEPLELEGEAGEGPPRAADDHQDTASEGVGGEWLRYHQLWRDFLLQRLAIHDRARLERLRQRAAEYALRRGQSEVAVEHLLEFGQAAGDWSAAAALLLDLAERELARGRAARLLTWIQGLPAEALDAHPRLLIHAARALRRLERVKEALAMSERAERCASAARQWNEVYLARATRAQLLAILGRGEQAVTMVVELLEQFNRQPRPDELRVHVETSACATFGMAGRPREAIAHGGAVLARLSCVRNREERQYLAAAAHMSLGIQYARVGPPEQAETHYRASERLWRQLGNVTYQAAALNGLARLKLRVGDREGAEQAFRRGIALAESIGHLGGQVILRNNLARCQRERGAILAAQATIEETLPLARQIDEVSLLGDALQEAGMIALQLHHSLEAIRFLEQAQDIAQEHWPASLAVCQALLALAYARAGRLGEAKETMEQARQAMVTTRAPDDRLRAYVALVGGEAALHSSASRGAAHPRPERATPVRAVPSNGVTTSLRRARRWARDHGLLPVFFAECSQYPETARLLLNERRVPADVAGRLPAVVAGEAADGAGQTPEPPVIRALPRLVPDATFEIRLFGTPTLLRNGRAGGTWRTNLVKELLVYLALRAGTTARSEAIVDALLPDTPFERSLTALRHAIYHLRRLFTPLNPIQTASGGYCLELGPAVRCDVHEFQSLLERGRPARGPVDVEALEEAVRCYRGTLLDGVDGEWAHQARAELECQFIMGAQTLLEEYERLRRHEAAIAVAQRVLAIDPFYEEFHLALLRHQLAMGQLSAARRHYRHYSQLMREAFGREPSPEAARMLAPLSLVVQAT